MGFLNLVRSGFYLLCIAASSNALNVKVNGDIDLGQSWLNLTDSLRGLVSGFNIVNRQHTHSSEDSAGTDDDHNVKRAETRVKNEKPFKYEEENASKDLVVFKATNQGNKIQTLMDKTCKKGVSYMRKLNETTDIYRMKKRITYAVKTFKKIYKRFTKKTLAIKLKTDLGEQRLILNVLETFTKLLNRLTNYLLIEMTKIGVAKSVAADLESCYKQHLSNAISSVYNYTCDSLYICRNQYTFSDFLSDALRNVLGAKLHMVRQATDSTFEYLKYVDYTPIVDSNTCRNIRNSIKCLEGKSNLEIRSMTAIFRNVVVNRNMPLTVMSKVKIEVITRTMAFLDILDIVDRSLPSNDINKLRWQDYLQCLKDWAIGNRNDVQEVIEAILKNLRTSLTGQVPKESLDLLVVKLKDLLK